MVPMVVSDTLWLAPELVKDKLDAADPPEEIIVTVAGVSGREVRLGVVEIGLKVETRDESVDEEETADGGKDKEEEVDDVGTTAGTVVLDDMLDVEPTPVISKKSK